MKIPAISATPINIHRGKAAAALSTTPPPHDADRAGRKSGIAPANSPAAKHPESVNPTQPPPHRPQPVLTLEGLLDNWGSSNTDYDLNGDGTVDSADLFTFLSDVQSPNGNAHAVVDLTGQTADANGAGPASDGNPSPSEPLTVDGFYGNWGTNNGAYDLNGDGTVGAADLFEYLGSLETPEEAGGSNATPGDALGTSGSEPVGSPKDSVQESLTLEDILQAWGAEGGRADVNGDGTVNGQDLFQYLGSLPVPPSADGPAGREALQQLADRLVQRFQASGHIHQPPHDLHQVVQDTKLNARDQKLLLNNVAQRYPQASLYNKVI